LPVLAHMFGGVGEAFNYQTASKVVAETLLFDAAAVVQKAASDAAALTELTPDKLETLLFNVIDALTASETPTIAATLAPSDALTAAEIVANAATIALVDAATMTEQPASAGQLLSISVSDAVGFAEGAAALAIALAASDAGTASEGATSLANVLAVSDTSSLAEALAASAAVAALDTLAWNEASADAGRLEQIAASDALLLTSEISATALSLALADSGTLGDAVNDIRLATSETHTVADAASILASLLAAEAATLAVESATGGELRDVSGSDLLTLAESSAIASVVLKAASDALSSTDASTLAALLDRSDTSGLAETLTLAATLLATDAAGEAEVAALAAEVFTSDAFSSFDLANLNTAAFVRILAAVVSAAATIKGMTGARGSITATGRASATVAGEAEAAL
jgi:hypothetical protein